MVAFLLALALAGEVTEDQIAAYADASAKERAARIESTAKEIERLKSVRRRDVLAEYRSIRWEFPDKKPTATEFVKEEDRKRAAKIADAEHRLAELKDRSRPYYARQIPKKPGDIGQLDGVKVFQIVDKSAALIEYDNGHLYWLSGAKTADWRDGQHVSPKGVFWIAGNKTYETGDGGTSTVFLIEPLDMREHATRFSPAGSSANPPTAKQSR